MATKTNDNLTYKTVQQKMCEVTVYYIAKYVEWYLSDKNERCTWDELCQCDKNFKSKSGVNKTEKFARENWLTREDTQKAIQIYMKHMKTINTMQIYQKMLTKALDGDVNAAKYVESFHNSDFFDESEDELNDFLDNINIPALKRGGGKNASK